MNCLNLKIYVDLVTKDDIPNIHKLIDDLYSNPLNDSNTFEKRYINSLPM